MDQEHAKMPSNFRKKLSIEKKYYVIFVKRPCVYKNMNFVFESDILDENLISNMTTNFWGMPEVVAYAWPQKLLMIFRMVFPPFCLAWFFYRRKNYPMATS